MAKSSLFSMSYSFYIKSSSKIYLTTDQKFIIN
nr:MAG TPA_asm: hypothetical protein [Caudoviricetes sp.]